MKPVARRPNAGRRPQEKAPAAAEEKEEGELTPEKAPAPPAETPAQAKRRQKIEEAKAAQVSEQGRRPREAAAKGRGLQGT